MRWLSWLAGGVPGYSEPVRSLGGWRRCEAWQRITSTTEHHAAIIEGVDRVCSDFGDEYWSAKDQAHEFPWEFYDAMAAAERMGAAYR